MIRFARVAAWLSALLVALGLVAALFIVPSTARAAAQPALEGQPTITSVTPNAGPTTGITAAVITGTNFTGTLEVLFGGVRASYSVVSDTQIDATAPAQPAGTVNITVINADWISSTVPADLFTFQQVPPSVSGLSPISGGIAGGTIVTITGVGFTGATSVKFGTAAATDVRVASDTQLSAVSPAGSLGVQDVVVTTPAGVSTASSAAAFTYEKAPTVTAVSPRYGPALGGTTVTVTGTAFTGASGVFFGIRAATSFKVLSSTQISAVAPAHLAGLVDVTVATAAGSSPVGKADDFTFDGTPTVTSVSPKTGSAKGGTTVTIKGTGFTGATSVKFGAVAATKLTVVSDSEVTAVAPTHAAGVVDITVTTVEGTSAVVSADRFSYK